MAERQRSKYFLVSLLTLLTIVSKKVRRKRLESEQSRSRSLRDESRGTRVVRETVSELRTLKREVWNWDLGFGLGYYRFAVLVLPLGQSPKGQIGCCQHAVGQLDLGGKAQN